jgi:hypothetical protein
MFLQESNMSTPESTKDFGRNIRPRIAAGIEIFSMMEQSRNVTVSASFFSKPAWQ